MDENSRQFRSKTYDHTQTPSSDQVEAWPGQQPGTLPRVRRQRRYAGL